MGRGQWLLLVAITLAGILTLALAGFAVVRWRAAPAPPTLDPRVVLTVTPIPTVPPSAPATSTPQPTPNATPQAASPSLSSIMQRALHGVVQIQVPDGQGTGFIWSRETARTLIVTAAHVVEGWERADVIAPDGTAHPGTIPNRDEQRDVAILEAPALAGVEALPRGHSHSLPPGTTLIAMGYAAGDQLLGDPTVTRGVLSGRRTFDGIEFLQTDTPMNPGVSGGPLLDEQGAVVGMAVGTLAWVGEMPAQNLNFAVAIEEIERVVRGIEKG